MEFWAKLKMKKSILNFLLLLKFNFKILLRQHLSINLFNLIKIFKNI